MILTKMKQTGGKRESNFSPGILQILGVYLLTYFISLLFKSGLFLLLH